MLLVSVRYRRQGHQSQSKVSGPPSRPQLQWQHLHLPSYLPQMLGPAALAKPNLKSWSASLEPHNLLLLLLVVTLVRIQQLLMVVVIKVLPPPVDPGTWWRRQVCTAMFDAARQLGTNVYTAMLIA